MTRRRVEVHIEELVLHGFPRLDARAVAEAVERELGPLVAAGEPAWRGGSVDAGSFAATSLAPGALGTGIAARLRDALA